MKLQNPRAWWDRVNEEKSSTLSLMMLFVLISTETLMTKPMHFVTLNSCHGQGNEAQDGESCITMHLQSCGRNRGWSDIPATPDTLCGWPGCKTYGVHTIFTNVYC